MVFYFSSQNEMKWDESHMCATLTVHEKRSFQNGLFLSP